MTEVVFASYHPKAGKELDLEKLIKAHAPVLRELELITRRPQLTLKSENGTYIEIIEWIEVGAANRAHEHPAVAKIWEGMAAISEFVKIADVTEAGKAFSHFKVVPHLSENFV